MGNQSSSSAAKDGLTDDELKFWYSKDTKQISGPQLSLQKAKSILKKFAKLQQLKYKDKLDAYEKLAEEIFASCDDSGKDKLTFEEFRVFISFFCKKTKWTALLTPTVIDTAFPKHNGCFDRFQSYSTTSFIMEYDLPLLGKLWLKKFPDTKPPPVPSDEWSKLGFQGSDPETDFRGAGKCGIDCLLALSEHLHFFTSINKMCDDHNFPFAVVCLNVVMLIYEFLGWGFKSPGVPACTPGSYKILLQLIFDFPANKADEEVFPESLIAFHDVFFLVFGVLVDAVGDLGTRNYMDFPKVLIQTHSKLDALLPRLASRAQVKKYLGNKLGIGAPSSDVDILQPRSQRNSGSSTPLKTSNGPTPHGISKSPFNSRSSKSSSEASSISIPPPPSDVPPPPSRSTPIIPRSAPVSVGTVTPPGYSPTIAAKHAPQQLQQLQQLQPVQQQPQEQQPPIPPRPTSPPGELLNLNQFSTPPPPSYDPPPLPSGIGKAGLVAPATAPTTLTTTTITTTTTTTIAASAPPTTAPPQLPIPSSSGSLPSSKRTTPVGTEFTGIPTFALLSAPVPPVLTDTGSSSSSVPSTPPPSTPNPSVHSMSTSSSSSSLPSVSSGSYVIVSAPVPPPSSVPPSPSQPSTSSTASTPPPQNDRKRSTSKSNLFAAAIAAIRTGSSSDATNVRSKNSPSNSPYTTDDEEVEDEQSANRRKGATTKSKDKRKMHRQNTEIGITNSARSPDSAFMKILKRTNTSTDVEKHKATSGSSQDAQQKPPQHIPPPQQSPKKELPSSLRLSAPSLKTIERREKDVVFEKEREKSVIIGTEPDLTPRSSLLSELENMLNENIEILEASQRQPQPPPPPPTQQKSPSGSPTKNNPVRQPQPLLLPSQGIPNELPPLPPPRQQYAKGRSISESTSGSIRSFNSRIRPLFQVPSTPTTPSVPGMVPQPIEVLQEQIQNLLQIAESNQQLHLLRPPPPQPHQQIQKKLSATLIKRLSEHHIEGGGKLRSTNSREPDDHGDRSEVSFVGTETETSDDAEAIAQLLSQHLGIGLSVMKVTSSGSTSEKKEEKEEKKEEKNEEKEKKELQTPPPAQRAQSPPKNLKSSNPQQQAQQEFLKSGSSSSESKLQTKSSQLFEELSKQLSEPTLQASVDMEDSHGYDNANDELDDEKENQKSSSFNRSSSFGLSRSGSSSSDGKRNITITQKIQESETGIKKVESEKELKTATIPPKPVLLAAISKVSSTDIGEEDSDSDIDDNLKNVDEVIAEVFSPRREGNAQTQQLQQQPQSQPLQQQITPQSQTKQPQNPLRNSQGTLNSNSAVSRAVIPSRPVSSDNTATTLLTVLSESDSSGKNAEELQQAELAKQNEKAIIDATPADDDENQEEDCMDFLKYQEQQHKALQAKLASQSPVQTPQQQQKLKQLGLALPTLSMASIPSASPSHSSNTTSSGQPSRGHNRVSDGTENDDDNVSTVDNSHVSTSVYGTGSNYSTTSYNDSEIRSSKGSLSHRASLTFGHIVGTMTGSGSSSSAQKKDSKRSLVRSFTEDGINNSNKNTKVKQHDRTAVNRSYSSEDRTEIHKENSVNIDMKFPSRDSLKASGKLAATLANSSPTSNSLVREKKKRFKLMRRKNATKVDKQSRRATTPPSTSHSHSHSRSLSQSNQTAISEQSISDTRSPQRDAPAPMGNSPMSSRDSMDQMVSPPSTSPRRILKQLLPSPRRKSARDLYANSVEVSSPVLNSTPPMKLPSTASQNEFEEETSSDSEYEYITPRSYNNNNNSSKNSKDSRDSRDSRDGRDNNNNNNNNNNNMKNKNNNDSHGVGSRLEEYASHGGIFGDEKLADFLAELESDIATLRPQSKQQQHVST